MPGLIIYRVEQRRQCNHVRRPKHIEHKPALTGRAALVLAAEMLIIFFTKRSYWSFTSADFIGAEQNRPVRDERGARLSLICIICAVRFRGLSGALCCSVLLHYWIP